MSGVALSHDTKCRSFGFVNNPPRGYFKTLKTCYPSRAAPESQPEVKLQAAVAPDIDIDSLVPDTPQLGSQTDNCFTVSSLTTDGTITIEDVNMDGKLFRLGVVGGVSPNVGVTGCANVPQPTPSMIGGFTVGDNTDCETVGLICAGLGNGGSLLEFRKLVTLGSVDEIDGMGDATVNIQATPVGVLRDTYTGASPVDEGVVRFRNLDNLTSTVSPAAVNVLAGVSEDCSTVLFRQIVASGPDLNVMLDEEANVEISCQGASAVTLSNTCSPDSGDGNLVVGGLGPDLTIKGLKAGEGIVLDSDADCVTIANSDGASTVTLSNTCSPNSGDGNLVVDGTGPDLTIKGLKAGEGIILDSDADCVTISATGDGGSPGGGGGAGIQTMWMSGFPDQSTSPNEFIFTGTNILVDDPNTENLTGDFSTKFGVRNNHVAIVVKAITTGGDIVITGTSISETTSLPVTSDTETITVDTSTGGSPPGQGYQTNKKWYQIDSVNVTSGTVTGITYDIRILGYSDLSNMNFTITGYRVEARSGSSGGKTDMTFIIEKVQDEGGKKYSIVPMEDITIDNETNTVTDSIRTVGSRSYTMSVAMGNELWADDTFFVLKQGDFNTFFSGDENVIEGATKHEGIIVRITGNTLGAPSGTNYQRVQIRYTQD